MAKHPKDIIYAAHSSRLLGRLHDGKSLIVAEGYLFEFERRGYLRAGHFIPEVVLEHPELVRVLHEEFVHAGSDVVMAFMYYGHREKMRELGRESDLEKMNRMALKLAREVADRTGTLMAGGLSNTCIYSPDSPETHEVARKIFKEQIEWAVEGGADFLVADSMPIFGEAMLALEAIKQYGKGLPAVVTISPLSPNTEDGVPYCEALRRFEEAGAAVVGFNCFAGPDTMMPMLREARRVCKGPMAALSAPYRTTKECPTYFNLTDVKSGEQAYPLNLCSHMCSRVEIAQFARDCRDLGIQYVGLCCGNYANLTRELAEAFGRTPPASAYSPRLEQSFIFAADPKYKKPDTAENKNAAE